MNKLNKNTRKFIKEQKVYKQPSIKSFPPVLEGVIKEIAKEMNEPLIEVKRVIDSMCRFTAKIIHKGDMEKGFEDIQWIYFGTFRVSENKLDDYKEYLKRKEEELNGLESNKLNKKGI